MRVMKYFSCSETFGSLSLRRISCTSEGIGAGSGSTARSFLLGQRIANAAEVRIPSASQNATTCSGSGERFQSPSRQR